MKIDALVMHARDNVATAVRDLQPGEPVYVRQGEGVGSLDGKEAVAYGPNLALREIAEGDAIIKYGEKIGRATRRIPQGFHVHVHNVESLRGRGDWKTGR